MTKATRTLRIMENDVKRFYFRNLHKPAINTSKFVGETIEALVAPLHVPTWVRRNKDMGSQEKYTFPQKVGLGTITASAMIYFVGTVGGLNAFTRNLERPSVLQTLGLIYGVPLATNAASALYEWGRDAYIRASEEERWKI